MISLVLRGRGMEKEGRGKGVKDGERSMRNGDRMQGCRMRNEEWRTEEEE